MNRRTPHSLRPGAALAICLVGAGGTFSPGLQANDIQVGRYSLLAATPTVAQADLLATTLTVRFPERLQTVGEAVRHLLKRSGYRLAAPEAMGAETTALLALPLPVVHRTLGPISLRSALETLAGPTFRLIEDPIHRLIAFERCLPVGRTDPHHASDTRSEASSDAR